MLPTEQALPADTAIPAMSKRISCAAAATPGMRYEPIAGCRSAAASDRLAAERRHGVVEIARAASA